MTKASSSSWYLLWLRACMAGVFLMIAIGGFTRLSGSGLSIIEWKPIVGTLPPLSSTAWQEEFGKYNTSPEYQKVNFDISLRRFQFIYMVEYVHRLVGRLVGLIFLIPLAFFWIRRTLSQVQKRFFILLTLIGISQGFMGWYMVKSGLVNDPMVNPTRLTAHLLIATVILILFYKEALQTLHVKKQPRTQHKEVSSTRRHPILSRIGFMVSICTLAYGGLVAGHKAGLIYNTFPLMNGAIFPSSEWQPALALGNLYKSPAIVQFVHRALALLTFAIGIILAMKNINLKTCVTRYGFFSSSLLLLACLLLQLTLGILTLIRSAPLSLALAHQLLGIIVVMLFFRIWFTQMKLKL